MLYRDCLFSPDIVLRSPPFCARDFRPSDPSVCGSLALSTDRAELHYFTDPETVPGGYAILSHVWGKKEQLFHQTPKYDEDLLLQRPNARDAASKKVRQICIIAQQDRFRWLWDDTCCINKDSSAELSEAINSMYRYYSLAAVCYAYLADVPSNRFSCDPEGPFAKSRWHMRGWTLQELIAAPVVKFISSDWQKLGTKMRHARFLSRITNIPVEVLLMDKPVTSFSIAQRMSWAYKRETTRVEDRAYSLMGIFAVNMTTIYGEGERAFQRLQEEIMEQSIDPSLFAWGSFSGMSSHERSAGHEHTKYESYLLARSPDDFNPSDSGRTRFLPNTFRSVSTYSRMKEIPTFTMTPYGCLCRLMCFGFGELTLAWMGCDWDGFEGETRFLWLLLRRCQDPPPDESKPLYHCVALSTGYRQGSRLVGLSEADWPWASFTLRPQELYIALWHTTPTSANVRNRASGNATRAENCNAKIGKQGIGIHKLAVVNLGGARRFIRPSRTLIAVTLHTRGLPYIYHLIAIL